MYKRFAKLIREKASCSRQRQTKGNLGTQSYRAPKGSQLPKDRFFCCNKEHSVIIVYNVRCNKLFTDKGKPIGILGRKAIGPEKAASYQRRSKK